MNTDLSNKSAFVAGSSQGIGKAIALKLAENGADVVINGRTPAPGLETVRQIQNMGRRSLFEKADITSYKEVKKAVEDVLSKWGNIDILVATGAGGDPPPRLFNKTDPELYIDYLKTRMLCRLYCVRAVIDHMIEKQAGKIIIISTDAGRVPTTGESLIGAAAAGINLATKVLAKELSKWHIHINTICTTVTANTKGYEKVLSGEMAGIFEKAARAMPFWPLKPEDIAELALFLASPDSDRITGQIFSINCGLSFPG